MTDKRREIDTSADSALLSRVWREEEGVNSGQSEGDGGPRTTSHLLLLSHTRSSSNVSLSSTMLGWGESRRRLATSLRISSASTFDCTDKDEW